MIGLELDNRNGILVAIFLMPPAALAEPASRQHGRKVGDLPRNCRQHVRRRTELRNTRPQRQGIWMARAVDDRTARSAFQHLASMHHDNAGTPRDRQRKIVGHEQLRHSALPRQIAYQIEDRRFGQYVETRRRLVRDQQFRFAAQCQGNPDTLTLFSR